MMSFKDIDLARVSFDADGQPGLDKRDLRIVLTPAKEDVLTTRYGFNLDDLARMRGEETRGTARLAVEVDGDLATFLTSLDDACKAAYTGTGEWIPMVHEGSDGDKRVNIKVKMTGYDSTQPIRVSQQGGGLVIYSKDDLIEAVDNYDRFQDALAKMAVTPKVFDYEGRAGVLLWCLQLSVKPVVTNSFVLHDF